MSDQQTYAGNNHAIGPGLHIAFGNPSFFLKLGSKSWLTEWHYYFGPSVVNKNGDPLKDQPGERSPFWLIAQWWFDQGCKVVDGVGVWSEPPTEAVKCAKTGREFTFWVGYHSWGTVRKL